MFTFVFSSFVTDEGALCSPHGPDSLQSPSVIRMRWWAGEAGAVKDGQSGAVRPDMTNPEGDASLSLGCCVK